MDVSTTEDVRTSQAESLPAPAQADQPDATPPADQDAPQQDPRQAIEQDFAVDFSTVPEELRPAVEAEVEKFRKPLVQKLHKRSDQLAAERRAAQQSAQWRALALEMLKDPAARDRYVKEYGPSLGVTPSTPAEDVGNLTPEEYTAMIERRAREIADERVQHALHADKAKQSYEQRWTGAWSGFENHPKYGPQFKILAPLVEAQMTRPNGPYMQAYTGDNEAEVIERAFLDVRKAYDDLHSVEKARRVHAQQPTTLPSSQLAKTGDAHWDTKAEILAEVRNELGA